MLASEGTAAEQAVQWENEKEGAERKQACWAYKLRVFKK